MSRYEDAVARLRAAAWLMQPDAQRLLALLDGAAGRTRAVGGAVRDTLLGRDDGSTDLDLATELTPDDVMARAEAAGVAVYPTGIAHGTVTLRLGGLVAEVTTLREDVETDGRHAQVRFGTDWRRDAERRDFTLNALYADMHGVLFDPLGGIMDCLGGQVRFIGDAATRIAEDRLRVYRFFRFSASHGSEQFDAAGLAACAAAAGTLDRLAAERVGAEMRRMLALPRLATTLRRMAEAGVLPLDAELVGLLKRYDQRAERPGLAGRLALLFTAISPRELQQMWRLANDDIRRGEEVLAAARLIIDFELHAAAFHHPDALKDGLDVAASLADWTEAGRDAVAHRLGEISVPRFPLSGADLIERGLEGPAIGQALGKLEKLWIDSGFALDRDALIQALEA